MSCLRRSRVLDARSGRSPGTDAITLTAPVVGLDRDDRAAAPLAPGVEAIAAWSWSIASCWASASSVSVMSAPSGGWFASWSMIDANSFCSPLSRSFSESSIPVRPTSTKL